MILIYITTKDKPEAVFIARELLAKKLIACANITDGVTSIYEWDGRLCEENEAVMILKTKKSLFESVKEEVLKLHSYDNPAILRIDVSSASEKFAAWVASQTKS